NSGTLAKFFLMRSFGFILGCAAAILSTSAVASFAEASVQKEHLRDNQANAAFKFEKIPQPTAEDAATQAKISIIKGRQDRASNGLGALTDGYVPANEDAPGANFFFAPGTDGGWLLFDLGKPISIKQINSYSWHRDTRAAQVYTVYGSDKAIDETAPSANQLESKGWKKISQLDSRPGKNVEEGGQYGASIAAADKPFGPFQFLLFAISATETNDNFGNTFYSEIDIINANAPAPKSGPIQPQGLTNFSVGNFHFQLDTSDALDLTDWAVNELRPIITNWYPKIVKMLPGDNYQAPTNVTIEIKNMDGVAHASGSTISCSADWFRKNLQGEAKGAVVHELVHVVQQYGRRRANPDGRRAERPGWLVEGIPDYIRWYLYESTSEGARIRNVERARYDGNYRVTANFLNWVVKNHGEDVIPRLNAALREGSYDASLWEKMTGKTAQQLGEEWKASLSKQ
ncbi:MAG: basic secretory protein-like protein, partial [Verrucomicrobiales bacterium]